MTDLLGLVGAVAFALCAAPQAWHTWVRGRADDISLPFLLLWALGEGCMLLYVLLGSQDPYLLLNYIANGACLVVILRYRLWPRSRKERTDAETEERST